MIVTLTVVIAVIVIVAGYNIYRYPAMFRHLTDESLSEEAVGQLRAELAGQPDKQVLAAYFSYSGTTRAVAGALAEETGADLFEISPSEAYTNVYMQSNSEIWRNERPALTAQVDHMEDYDIVFVGYPVWWHATPTPVSTFLESYDLNGKLVIPFCTSGGSDISETMPTFLNSCRGLAVYGGRRVRSAGEIGPWLEERNLNLEAGRAQSGQK